MEGKGSAMPERDRSQFETNFFSINHEVAMAKDLLFLHGLNDPTYGANLHIKQSL
jgi:hypothetical protein